MLTKNINDVDTADEQDWVTIFNHLFIGLCADARSGHENPKLSMSEAL